MVAEAARVALATVIAFVQEVTSLREAIFVLFDHDTCSSYRNALKKLVAEK